MAVPAAICLVALASLLIISTYSVFNFTIDEPAHLAAGMEWIEGHRYTYEDLHPPLARIFGALGPHLLGTHWNRNPSMWYEGFALLGGADGDRVLWYGRLGILPFFWLASAVVFLWAKHLAGSQAGLMACFFFTTLPPILAHSGLVTTDMPLTGCMGAALLASLMWSEKPTPIRAILFGAAMALAIVSKFSALVFLPAAWVLAYLVHLAKRRPTAMQCAQDIKRLLPSWGLALLTCSFLIVAVYRFQSGVFLFHGYPVRVPAISFFTGIQSAIARNGSVGNTYLLGDRQFGGFWYFFPVVLFLKTPIPTLLMLLAGAWLAARRVATQGILIPLATSLAVLLVGMASRINIGSRHVLPIYLGAAVAAGIAGSHLMSSDKWLSRLVIIFMLVWQGVAVLVHRPEYISYANEFARGHAEQLFSDSDLDWGQDMKRLATRLNELHVSEIYFDVFNRGYLLTGKPFPAITPMPGGSMPPIGWTALSQSIWKIDGAAPWANHVSPTERIGGGSIFLFHIEKPPVSIHPQPPMDGR